MRKVGEKMNRQTNSHLWTDGEHPDWCTTSEWADYIQPDVAHPSERARNIPDPVVEVKLSILSKLLLEAIWLLPIRNKKLVGSTGPTYKWPPVKMHHISAIWIRVQMGWWLPDWSSSSGCLMDITLLGWFSGCLESTNIRLTTTATPTTTTMEILFGRQLRAAAPEEPSGSPPYRQHWLIIRREYWGINVSWLDRQMGWKNETPHIC